MAQAVLQHTASVLPPSHNPASPYPRIRVDSAGMINYHEGESPDPRGLATLQDHGITDFEHAARPLRNSDFDEFDYILAMDRENLKDITRRARRLKKPINSEGSSKGGCRVCLFGDFDAELRSAGNQSLDEWEREIQDPYYGGDGGFEENFLQCVRFSRGLLKEVIGVEVEIDAKGNLAIPPEQGRSSS